MGHRLPGTFDPSQPLGPSTYRPLGIGTADIGMAGFWRPASRTTEAPTSRHPFRSGSSYRANTDCSYHGSTRGLYELTNRP
jgi:hypothetical protein